MHLLTNSKSQFFIALVSFAFVFLTIVELTTNVRIIQNTIFLSPIYHLNNLIVRFIVHDIIYVIAVLASAGFVGVLWAKLLLFMLKNFKHKTTFQKIWSLLIFFFISFIIWSFSILTACLMSVTEARNVITNKCETFSTSCIAVGYRADDTCPSKYNNPSSVPYYSN